MQDANLGSMKAWVGDVIRKNLKTQSARKTAAEGAEKIFFVVSDLRFIRIECHANLGYFGYGYETQGLSTSFG